MHAATLTVGLKPLQNKMFKMKCLSVYLSVSGSTNEEEFTMNCSFYHAFDIALHRSMFHVRVFYVAEAKQLLYQDFGIKNPRLNLSHNVYSQKSNAGIVVYL